MVLKSGDLIVLFAVFGFLGIMMPGLIFPAGGDIGQEDIAESVHRRTKGCSSGGANPKGFTYSEFPDAYRVWYDINISAQEMECMKTTKVITMLPKDKSSNLVGRKSRMGKPPEWFKPKELIATLEGKSASFLLTAGDGQKEHYFITSGAND